MAISYPRPQPTSIGIEQITLRAVNAVATSRSPFTFKQQVFQHAGAVWQADVTIPPLRRDVTQAWVGMLTSLYGMAGTMLLGDPDHTEPLGTATALTITGSARDKTITVNTLNGTLKAGDHFQVGTGADSRLHMVVIDKASGAGGMEIWPPLRSDYTSVTASLDTPQGVFRLSSNVTEWSINNANQYGITFSVEEDLT